MTLLEQSKKKFYNRKTKEISYKNKTFKEFVMECYLEMDPSRYGSHIQKMLEHLCDEKNIRIFKVPDKENCGDVTIKYPQEPYTFWYRHENELWYEVDYPSSIIPVQKNWEFKVSYLGKTDGYTIRNIRRYQTINGGYILCLIDCENDFNEEFYVIDFSVLEENFLLSHMNGTKKQHEDSGFENLGTAFKKDSVQHDVLKKFNKLKGNTINDLYSYFKEVKTELHNEFLNSDDCKKIIEDELNKIETYTIEFYRDVDNFVERRNECLKFLLSKYKCIINFLIDKSDATYIQVKIKGRIASYDVVCDIEKELSEHFDKTLKTNKEKKTIYHFEVLGKKYQSNIFTENYIQFLKDVSHIHDYEFFRELIPNYFISDEYDGLSDLSREKNQVHSINDKFFISAYSSTAKKINHINAICQKMNINLDTLFCSTDKNEEVTYPFFGNI
jgi:hypothetical protein